MNNLDFSVNENVYKALVKYKFVKANGAVDSPYVLDNNLHFANQITFSQGQKLTILLASTLIQECLKVN